MTSALTNRRRTAQWLLWAAALVGATALLLVLRAELDKAHVALLFLLIVLGGSAAGGRMLGLTLAAAAFLIFDVGFLPPFNTLRVADPFDWIVLFAFLVTGIVGAELLERQRREAEIARSRTSEIDRIATLGAETLNAPRPEYALRAIADVIRQLMGTARCDIAAVDASAAADAGSAALQAELHMSSGLLPARERVIPLVVRGVRVGTLRLSADRPFLLSPDQERVLGALSYYAALGVERLRLAAAEDEAESLRRADRLKDALLASVSHDLRTPLTTIKGIAHEIARDGDASRAYIIEEEVDRLTALVSDLLDLSQLAAGAMPVHESLEPADDVIGVALQRVEAAYPDREIRTTLAGEWTSLVGRFDFVHTLRVLTNVLENAAKYAPAGTPITLRVWRDAERLYFAVEDCGASVAEADRDRLFLPFVRGIHDAGAARGTGLGLSIARRLMEVQHGTLVYEPTAGASSRFVLSLPAADVPTD